MVEHAVGGGESSSGEEEVNDWEKEESVKPSSPIRSGGLGVRPRDFFAGSIEGGWTRLCWA